MKLNYVTLKLLHLFTMYVDVMRKILLNKKYSIKNIGKRNAVRRHI